MDAKPHPQQSLRLQALHSYEVLDTDREADFDDIVKLAAAICGTNISVVNLIDAERQWFKAETGLGVRETPLATSICSHIILEEEFSEINDTLQDPRMTDNPLCCGDPGLRFYAGALLKTPDGLPLGTLCVLDHAPRALTPLQRDTLKVLARQVMVQLEMRKALRTADMLRKEVDHRVKNSLQSLSSLARVQMRQATSPDVVEAIEGFRNRVAAVSTLHEHLYKTDAGATLDLAKYVGIICDHLSRIAPSGVTLVIKAEPVTVSSRQAVSVGTLVNEFIANAFKHAFPDDATGTVTIRVMLLPDGNVRVEVADDGVGQPPTGSDPQSDGLGMKIAEIACMELQCELDFGAQARGVSCRFEFTPQQFV